MLEDDSKWIKVDCWTLILNFFQQLSNTPAMDIFFELLQLFNLHDVLFLFLNFPLCVLFCVSFQDLRNAKSQFEEARFNLVFSLGRWETEMFVIYFSL